MFLIVILLKITDLKIDNDVLNVLRAEFCKIQGYLYLDKNKTACPIGSETAQHY